MFKSSLFAAAIVTFGLASASHAETARIDCAEGELTLRRIAEGDCTARIPLPTQRRPGTVSATQDSSVAPAKPLVKPEYIEFTNDRGETKLIRLVGTRFLPEDEIDLRAHASTHPTKSVFSRAFSYFGFGASEPEVAVEGVQEARADLAAETVSN